jgi:hypothetical protein
MLVLPYWKSDLSLSEGQRVHWCCVMTFSTLLCVERLSRHQPALSRMIDDAHDDEVGFEPDALFGKKRSMSGLRLLGMPA